MDLRLLAGYLRYLREDTENVLPYNYDSKADKSLIHIEINYTKLILQNTDKLYCAFVRRRQSMRVLLTFVSNKEYYFKLWNQFY